ncbi:hypothetical protein CA85_34830 [Allorhodopirellula solitaria]|uniref:Uncharacterized protein n=1 Tax=Allorhodopirellula solitaria TaxID=2527987 RepID=A0A5C5XPJ4_9BACT|nr:hypothetical protein CA85_34830 [Allorhodopirellula solitaria]
MAVAMTMGDASNTANHQSTADRYTCILGASLISTRREADDSGTGALGDAVTDRISLVITSRKINTANQQHRSDEDTTTR